MKSETDSLTTAPSPRSRALEALVRQRIATDGGWIGFDRFMALALYAPGLGYYAGHSRVFGHWPGSGSDFVTAPELSPLFGRALAVQVAQALRATGTSEIWEFGAGTGVLAAQVLQALKDTHEADLAQLRYTIVDVSGSLRERQRETLKAFGERVRWVDELPAQMQGVMIGNEVLDAMPVKLLARQGGEWFERGVAVQDKALHWADRPTQERPPCDIEGEHDYVTEVHPQAEAFVRTLADRLQRGAAFFIDYGFPEHEYFHPQRHMGTLICHQAHRAGGDPLQELGQRDITAHVNFTGVALAAQDAGFEVLGYATQARFLMNCGLVNMLDQATAPERANGLKLILEHEMGELFKVLALGKGLDADGKPLRWDPIGFAVGDRSHTL